MEFNAQPNPQQHVVVGSKAFGGSNVQPIEQSTTDTMEQARNKPMNQDSESTAAAANVIDDDDDDNELFSTPIATNDSKDDDTTLLCLGHAKVNEFSQQWIRTNQPSPRCKLNTTNSNEDSKLTSMRSIVASVTVDDDECASNGQHDQQLTCDYVSSGVENTSLKECPLPVRHDEKVNADKQIESQKEENNDFDESALIVDVDNTHLSFVSWSESHHNNNDMASPPSSSTLNPSIVEASEDVMIMSPLSTMRHNAMHVQMEESNAYVTRIKELENELEKMKREMQKERLGYILQQLEDRENKQNKERNETNVKPIDVELDSLSSGTRLTRSLNNATDVFVDEWVEEQLKQADGNILNMEGISNVSMELVELRLACNKYRADYNKEKNEKDALLQERDSLRAELDRVVVAAASTNHLVCGSFGSLSAFTSPSPIARPFILGEEERGDFAASLEFSPNSLNESKSIGDDSGFLRVRQSQPDLKRDHLVTAIQGLQVNLKAVTAERDELKEKLDKLESEFQSLEMTNFSSTEPSWAGDMQSAEMEHNATPNGPSQTQADQRNNGSLPLYSVKVGKQLPTIRYGGRHVDHFRASEKSLAEQIRNVTENLQEQFSSFEGTMDASIGSFMIRLNQLCAAVLYLRSSLEFEESFGESPSSPGMDELPMNATFSIGKNLTSEFEQENELQQMEEARVRLEKEAIGLQKGSYATQWKQRPDESSVETSYVDQHNWLKAMHTTAASENSALSETLRQLECENQSLNNELSVTKRDYLDLRNELNKIKDELAAAKQMEIVSRKSETDSRNKLAVTVKQLAESEEKACHLNNSLESLTEKLRQLTVDRDEAEQRCHSAMEKMRELTAQRDEVEQRFQLTAEKVRELTIQRDEAEQRYNSTVEPLAVARFQRDECKSQLTAAFNRRMEVEATTRGQVNSLQAALKEVENRCHLLNHRSEQLEAAKCELQAENNELHTSLVQRESELNSLKRSFLGCNERIAELSEQQVASDELLAKEKEARDAAEVKLSATQARLVELQENLESVVRERQDICELLSIKTSEMSIAEKNVKDTTATLKETCSEVESLKTELAKVQLRLDDSMSASDAQKAKLHQTQVALESKENECLSLSKKAEEWCESYRLSENELGQLQTDLTRARNDLDTLRRTYFECNEQLTAISKMNAENEAGLRKVAEARDAADRQTSLAEARLIEEQAKSDTLRCERDLLVEQVAFLESDLSKKNAELLARDRSHKSVQDEADRANKLVKETMDELNNLKLSYVQCNDRLAEVSELSASNDAILTELTAARDAAHQKVSETEVRLKELQNRLDVLNGQHDSLQEILRRKDSELSDITAECIATKADRERVVQESAARMDELQSNLEQFSSSVERMTTQLVMELGGLRRQLQHSLTSRSHLLENAQYAFQDQSHSKNVEEEVSLWKRLIPVACSALDISEGRINAFQGDIQHLGYQLESLKRADEGLSRDAGLARKQCDLLSAKLREANDRNGQMEDDLAALQKQYQSAYVEAEAARRAIENLEGEKAELKSGYENEKRQLLRSLEQANNSLGVVGKKLQATMDELTFVREELVKTEEAFVTKSQESQQISSRNQVLTRKCARLREYIRQLTSRCEEWEAAYDHVMRMLRSQEEDVNDRNNSTVLEQSPLANRGKEELHTDERCQESHHDKLENKFKKIQSDISQLDWD